MMDRAIWLSASFVALPIKSCQRGSAFKLEVTLSKVPRLNNEMEAKHRRF